MTPDEHIFRLTEGQQRADLAQFQADTQRSLETMRAGNQAASDAIKTVTLLNGGAAVAILAFVGHLASTPSGRPVITSLRDALIGFVASTFSAVLASAIMYFIQECWVKTLDCQFKKRRLQQAATPVPAGNQTVEDLAMEEAGWRRRANILKVAAICCGLLALVGFAISSTKAYSAFKKLTLTATGEKGDASSR